MTVTSQTHYSMSQPLFLGLYIGLQE